VRFPRRLRLLVVLAVAIGVVIGACGGGSSDNAALNAPPDVEADAPVVESVVVPTPEVSIVGPIPGDAQTSPTTGFEEADYAAFEYFVSGDAASYDPVDALTDDGRWELTARDVAPYTTRIIVKRPLDPADFSGTVLVEWNNVTAGFESSPDFIFAREEILRKGHVHIAVSAQLAGIDAAPGGGLVGDFGAPLKLADPDRYADLDHPGDDYSYDLFAQIGALARAVPDGEVDPLDGLEAEQVIALGESQSAFRLTSFINGVHSLTPVYDGFFVHSRGGAHPGFDDGGSETAVRDSGAVRIRDDLDVPVLVLSTETDLTVLGYAPARQPDSDVFRGWEVAGTAHADSHLLGGDEQVAAEILGCAAPVNDGPQHFVVKAALAQLVEWVIDPADLPPRGDPIELADGQIVRDADGNALGGIRLAPTRVPVAALSGDPLGDSVICQLFGSTTVFDSAELAERYGDEATYRAEYEAALDEDVSAGFILAEDVEAALADVVSFTFG